MSVLMLVRCDAGGALGSCGMQVLTASCTTGQARAWAATQGWSYQDGLDLCPRHSGARTGRPRLPAEEDETGPQR